MAKLISRLKQNRFLQIVTISLRYFLGSSFVYASISKIQGKSFIKAGVEIPMGSIFSVIETMDNAGVYWQFVGWGQLLAGFLLMSQIFSTLGAVASFPIVLNIFVITTSFESTGILLFTSLLLLANLYLLLWDWNRLKFIALPKPQPYTDNTGAFSRRNVWVYLGVCYFISVIFVRKVVISNQMTDKSTLPDPVFSINFAVLCVIAMGVVWVISNSYQLMKK